MLAHLFKELIELLARISVDVDSVDQGTLLKELDARHTLISYENLSLSKLGRVGVKPCANL